MSRNSFETKPATSQWQTYQRLLRLVVLLGVIAFLLWQRYETAKKAPAARDVAVAPGEARVGVQVVEDDANEDAANEDVGDSTATRDAEPTDDSDRVEPGPKGSKALDGAKPAPPLKKRVEESKAKPAEKTTSKGSPRDDAEPPVAKSNTTNPPPSKFPSASKTSAVPSKTPPTAPSKTPPAAPSGPQTKIPNITIRDLDGKVVYQGAIDVSKTLDRIEAGRRLRFRNDGVVFENRERRLPAKPPGHYHEWVHPTEELDGPGPQRIVTGEDGEIYYTADHYRTFRRLDKPGR